MKINTLVSVLFLQFWASALLFAQNFETKDTTPPDSSPPPPVEYRDFETYKKLEETLQKDTNYIFTITEQMPEFPGGNTALFKWINDNLKYPAQAREAGIQGTVYISFIVEKDGSLTQIKTKRSIGMGCDKEAERLVKAMPNGMQGGKEAKMYG